jgi:hypothetical protein
MVIRANRGRGNRGARVLVRAVRSSKMPVATRSKVRWVRRPHSVGILIRGGAAPDLERLPLWVHRVENYMAARKVRAATWQVARPG